MTEITPNQLNIQDHSNQNMLNHDLNDSHIRIQHEFKQIESNPTPRFHVGPKDEDNLTKWIGTLSGPNGTPYEGYKFQFELNLSDQYPREHPSIEFLKPIYHCNISQQGLIQCGYLENWNDQCNIYELLENIYDLFEFPNPDNPLNLNAASVFLNNRKEYEDIVRQWCEKYAKEQ